MTWIRWKLYSFHQLGTGQKVNLPRENSSQAWSQQQPPRRLLNCSYHWYERSLRSKLSCKGEKGVVATVASLRLLKTLVPKVQSEALRRPCYRQTDGVAKKEEANNNSRQPQRGGLLQKAEPERMPQPPKGRPSTEGWTGEDALPSKGEALPKGLKEGAYASKLAEGFQLRHTVTDPLSIAIINWNTKENS